MKYTLKQELRKKGFLEHEIEKVELIRNPLKKDKVIEKMIKSSFDIEIVRRDLKREGII